MPLIELDKIVIDDTMYIRPGGLDAQNVASLMHSMQAGEPIPQAVVERSTMIMVDGRHRFDAARRLKRKSLDCVLKDYASPQKRLIDASRLNRSHGKALSQWDRVHISTLADALGGIEPEELADAMGITVEKLGELRSTRLGLLHTPRPASGTSKFAAHNGKAIALKYSVRHLAGRELSEAQVAAHDKLGGSDQLQTVNSLIMIIENEMLDTSNATLMARLQHLINILTRADSASAA
jgi:ParB-like chromosome segregation protein Spo0J